MSLIYGTTPESTVEEAAPHETERLLLQGGSVNKHADASEKALGAESGIPYFSNGLSLKTVVLLSLTLQNTAYTLLRRYSVGIQTKSAASAEILLVAELIKLSVSAYYCTTKSTDAAGSNSGVIDDVNIDAASVSCGNWLLKLAQHSLPMLGLAVIYGAMGILSFIALKVIDAAAFTIFNQLKLLTTAFFAMALLQRRLSGTKWRALVLIVVASVLVSTPYIDDDDDDSETSEEAAESDSSISAGSLSLGFGAVLVEVLLSGAASVYFEKVVKSADEQFTLWERNVQLGVYSICLYVGMLVYDAAANGKDIGSGWSWVTLIVAMLGAAGGLLVALSLKYADAILKALATSGAIVLSSLGGWALLNGPMTLPVALGCVVAIVATMNYTFDDMSLPESNHAEGTVSKVPAAI